MHLPDERVTTQRRKEGRKEGRQARTRRRERRKEGRKEGRQAGENLKEREKEGRKEGRRTREKAREKEQLPREGESPETNNSGLCWIDTRISFLLPFTLALDNKLFRQSWPLIQN